MNKAKHQDDLETATEETEATSSNTSPNFSDETVTEETKEPNKEQELKEQLLRAYADVENIRKRAQKEKEEALKYAASHFARDILTVADNLQRALQSVPVAEKENNPFLKTLVEGIEMTESSLLSAFTKHGIEPINPVGETFDHNWHQAMMEVETEEFPQGRIVQVLQIGFKMHDRLLRPAMVSVAKSPKAKPNLDEVV